LLLGSETKVSNNNETAKRSSQQKRSPEGVDGVHQRLALQSEPTTRKHDQQPAHRLNLCACTNKQVFVRKEKKKNSKKETTIVTGEFDLQACFARVNGSVIVVVELLIAQQLGTENDATANVCDKQKPLFI
jgi:hypothetical protein